MRGTFHACARRAGHSRGLAVLALAVMAGSTAAANATESRFAETGHQYQPGEVYTLAVHLKTEGGAASRSGLDRKHESLDATYAYQAQVEVLEVDFAGNPTRERHTGISLSVEKNGQLLKFAPKGSGIFAEIGGDGATRYFAGERGERPIRGTMENILRFVVVLTPEDWSNAALLGAEEPASEGDTWALDGPAMKERLAQTHLLTVKDPIGGTVALVTDAPGRTVLTYEAALSWLEVPGVHPNARIYSSEGTVSGTWKRTGGLDAQLVHTSTLNYRLKGASTGDPRLRGNRWQLDYTARRAETRTFPAGLARSE